MDSNINEMKQFVLSLARERNLDVGHALPLHVLRLSSLSLNPKQHEALLLAIEALQEEGIFEEREHDQILLLTQKGKDVLYP